MTTSKKIRTIADVKYHFVWYTMLKTNILSGEIKTKLHSILVDKCKDNAIKILGGIIRKNHVHMSLLCPPSLSPSKVGATLKRQFGQRA